MNKNWIALLLVIALLVMGCQAAAPSQTASNAPVAQDKAFEGESAPSAAARDSSTGGATANYAGTGQVQEEMIIKNAQISIVVVDPAASMENINKLASEMGGRLGSSNLSKYTTSDGSEYPRANITIYVPSEKLDEALARIKAEVQDPATDVRSENVTGENITKEYTDAKSRLANLEVTEKQIQKMMEDTKTTDEALAVYRELTNIRQEIEVLKGQIKYYEESAALSTISVELTAKTSLKPVVIAGWQPAGVARDAIQALVDALQGLANLLIWFSLFCLPLILVFAIPAFLIWRFIIRRLWKARKPAKPEAPAAPPQA
ncbi:MAG TPA: DUF4349 domain-containing protein [Anaerolineaceae bacterium]|nr:DUF4349 domain-containing protein [Anaerolineaceae bacterium]HPN52323.1 DUF4349 domain-containing protein [Anaerolineaceae bacterium]